MCKEYRCPNCFVDHEPERWNEETEILFGKQIIPFGSDREAFLSADYVCPTCNVVSFGKMIEVITQLAPVTELVEKKFTIPSAARVDSFGADDIISESQL